MKIYVISLARATERRQKMEAQATSLGLSFTFIDATDGKNLTDQDRALVDHDRRRRISLYPLADNEIGCWISHRRVMQHLIDSNETMAAVVEDDAKLAPDFERVLQAIETKAMPFDVIDLHRNFKKTEIFATCRPLLDKYALGRIGYTHMNTTAYVISREGALKFLAFAPRFAHAVDKELHRYWDNGLDIYGLETPIAVQDDGGYSYIDETRGQDRPHERVRYTDADTFYWRMQRRWTQLSDSVRKRLCFPAYVRKGQRAA